MSGVDLVWTMVRMPVMLVGALGLYWAISTAATRMLSAWRRFAQDFEGADGGGVAIFKALFFENAGGVDFHRVFGAAENRGNVGVGFA